MLRFTVYYFPTLENEPKNKNILFSILHLVKFYYLLDKERMLVSWISEIESLNLRLKFLQTSTQGKHDSRIRSFMGQWRCPQQITGHLISIVHKLYLRVAAHLRADFSMIVHYSRSSQLDQLYKADFMFSLTVPII